MRCRDELREVEKTASIVHRYAPEQVPLRWDSVSGVGSISVYMI